MAFLNMFFHFQLYSNSWIQIQLNLGERFFLELWWTPGLLELPRLLKWCNPTKKSRNPNFVSHFYIVLQFSHDFSILDRLPLFNIFASDQTARTKSGQFYFFTPYHCMETEKVRNWVVMMIWPMYVSLTWFLHRILKY